MKWFSTSRGRCILGWRKQMRVIDVPKLHQGQCHLSRSSRRSSKWDSSGSFKSDRIEGKVKIAELLAQASFLEASFLEKHHQVEKDAQRLRIQENLPKARARAQISENMELSEDQELQEEIFGNRQQSLYSRQIKMEDSKASHSRQDSDYLNQVYQA